MRGLSIRRTWNEIRPSLRKLPNPPTNQRPNQPINQSNQLTKQSIIQANQPNNQQASKPAIQAYFKPTIQHIQVTSQSSTLTNQTNQPTLKPTNAQPTNLRPISQRNQPTNEKPNQLSNYPLTNYKPFGGQVQRYKKRQCVVWSFFYSRKSAHQQPCHDAAYVSCISSRCTSDSSPTWAATWATTSVGYHNMILLYDTMMGCFVWLMCLGVRVIITCFLHVLPFEACF